MSVLASSVLRLAPDVRFRILDGEAVVVRQRSAEVLGLNAVGSRLLALLDGSRPLAVLIDALAAEYEVERAELERDLLAFASELVEQGVAEPVAAVAP